VDKNTPHEVFGQKTDIMTVRYLYNGPVKRVNLMKATTRQTRHTDSHIQHLQQLRSDPIPLPLAKYTDIVKLCKKKLIDTAHQAFFLGLPHDKETTQK